MTSSSRRMRRGAQALLYAVGAAIATGEGSLRYDVARHEGYAAHQLARRRQRIRDARENADAADALWLEREPPKFPYVLAMSPADNPAAVARAILGTSDHVIGSADESTSETLEALVAATSPVDALVQRLAKRWRELKMQLHGEVPTAFDPQRRLVQRQLDDLLSALQASISTEPRGLESQADDEQNESPAAAAEPEKLVFFLREFDHWDDATTTMWLQWIHDITSAGLAHVVLPTNVAVTPAAIRAWQRVHKVHGADFVAILLRVATGADQTSAVEKLIALNQCHSLDLRGFGEHEQKQDQEDVIGYEPSSLPTEVEIITDAVGNWWSDLAFVCQQLETRRLHELASPADRLALVQDVCAEYERETIYHVSKALEIHGEHQISGGGVADVDETRDQRISALQAWKCLEVVTGMRSEGQVNMTPQKLLQREGGKTPNCAHPVEALLPFNERVHGEAKFMDLVDQSVLYLRPKNAVEIGVLPCDATALVGPCWVETRPLVKQAFEKLWRDDATYLKIRELERFEDNHKMSEEIDLFEQEIHERRHELDAQTREFILLQHTMKKPQVAQRKAELALLELEIQSKLVYLERLRSLLD